MYQLVALHTAKEFSFMGILLVFLTRGSFSTDAAQDFCQELEEAVRRQVGENLWGGAGI